MNVKPKITSMQLLLLAVGSALVFPYTFLPIVNSPPANQDAWIVLVISYVYVFLLNLPALILMNKFRGVNMIQSTEIVLGKLLAKIIIVPIVIFTIFCYVACSLITLCFMDLYVLPDVPMWAVMLFMVIPTLYAAYKGIGTMARVSNFIVPFALATVVVFFLLGLKDMDLHNLEPVLADSNFIEINLGAFLTAARYSEIIILWVFSYYLVKNASINKVYAKALTTFGIVFMLIVISVITVLGVEYAKLAWSPYYIFTRQLKAFDFIQRMHSFNILAWFPVTLLKLTIYMYIGSELLAGIFKAKSHKPFIFPIAVIGYVFAVIPQINRSIVIDAIRSDEVFPFFIIPVILIIPAIILAVYLFRKKKVDAALKEVLAAKAHEDNE